MEESRDLHTAHNGEARAALGAAVRLGHEELPLSSCFDDLFMGLRLLMHSGKFVRLRLRHHVGL